MKHVLLTMTMACATISYAAPLHTKKAYVHPEHRLSHEMAWQHQNARMAAKGTATMRRLVTTTYAANGVLIDSNVHIYSGGRGSTHSTLPASYYDTYSMTGTDGGKTIFCDTSVGWYNNGSLQWDGTTVYAYDAANNTTRHLISSPYFMMLQEGMYNSNNQLVQVTTSDTFGGTPLVAKNRMYIMYDGSGNRVQDSMVSLATGTQSGKRLYTYDAGGNMLSYESYSIIGGSPLQLFYKAVYTYDANGRVVTGSTAYDFGNGLTNNSYDSFAYTGNALHPVHHRTATWVDTLGVWDDYEIMDYTLNTQGQPASFILYRHINQWDTLERDVYHYDTHGLLTGSNGYLYMGNGQYSSTPYDRSTLYYEEYDPNSVAEARKRGMTAELWPNPATGSLRFEAERGYTAMQVTDATGRVVLAKEGIAAGTHTIDIGTLPTGNYIMTLRNAADNAVMSAQFVKQ